MNFCKKLFCCTLAFVVTFKSIAQELKIGDKIPNVVLNNVTNDSHTTIRLSDFKGKIIIFDFWGTGCIPCIEAFPELNSLQSRFSKKLQIIAVNKESKDSTLKFFSEHKRIKVPQIPFVTADSFLVKLFPHGFVPLHVWIDTTNTVRFITNGWSITENNINNLWNGVSFNLAQAKYEKDSVISSPINEKWVKKTEYYSIISHCINGSSIGNKLVSTTGDRARPNRITRNCFSIINLFITAFSEKNKYDLSPRNTWFLENIDTSKFFLPSSNNNNEMDKWMQEYSYNYDLLIPQSKSNELFKIMQQDLMRYFDVKAKIEKRKIKCLSLIKISDHSKKKSYNNKYDRAEHLLVDSLLYTSYHSMKEFVESLKYIFLGKHSKYPLVDETGYIGDIDIRIKSSVLDEEFTFPSLRTELNEYGLDIVEKKKKLDVLVIKNNNKGLTKTNDKDY